LRAKSIGLGFNPTYFAHPKVRTDSRCRIVTNPIGSSGSNTASAPAKSARHWQSARQNVPYESLIPDGMKDTPADRKVRAGGGRIAGCGVQEED
jgi:L-rhamnose isomerase